MKIVLEILSTGMANASISTAIMSKSQAYNYSLHRFNNKMGFIQNIVFNY